MKIVCAGTANLDDLFALNREFNGDCTTREEMSKRLAAAGPQEIILIAYVAASAAGFACGQCYGSVCYSSSYGEVTEMYVRPAYRRKGVARELLRQLETAFEKRGVTGIEIVTGKDNDTARKVYEACGYRVEKKVVLRKINGTYYDYKETRDDPS